MKWKIIHVTSYKRYDDTVCKILFDRLIEDIQDCKAGYVWGQDKFLRTC